MAEQYLDGGALFHDCSIAQKCYMDIGQKENTGFKFYKVSRLRVQDLQIQLLPGRWPIWELLLCTELLCQVLTLPLWEVWKVTVQKSACAGRLLLSSPSHVSGSTVSAGLQPSGANGSWELTLSFVVRRKVIWNISNVSVCCWGFIWVSISGFTLRGWFLGGGTLVSVVPLSKIASAAAGGCVSLSCSPARDAVPFLGYFSRFSPEQLCVLPHSLEPY